MAVGLAPPARAGQRARRPGRRRALAPRASGCPATGPSFRDATRVAGRQHGDLARHLPRQRRRAGRRRSTTRWSACAACATLLAGGRRRRDRRRGTTPPATTAGGCSRPTWRAARCTSCASRCRTGRGSWPRSRSRSAARRQHRRHGALPGAGPLAPARSRCGSAGERGGRREAEALVRGLGLRGGAGVNARFDPAGPLRGTLRAPGRQVAVAPRGAARRDERRPVRVTGYLDAADTRSTLDAVRALGALVEGARPGALTIRGPGPARARRRARRSTSATPAR